MRRLLPLAVLALLVLAPVAAPQEGGRCTCRDGNACWHWLGAPVTPADDPCPCPQCRAAPGSCERVLPEGWDGVCFDNGKMECFLRRHAVSWRLSCSERLAGTCACKNPQPEFCPKCGPKGAEWDAEGPEILRRQQEVERPFLGDPRGFITVVSPHFYLVTDIRKLKVRTQSGSPRIIGMHELAHLYVQRAELAYLEFVRVIGKPAIPQPIAMYLVETRAAQEDLQEHWFGHRGMEILYGGGFRDVAGNFAYNGFAESLQDARDDRDLHVKVRHSIGHILISCWPKVAPFPPEMPHWMYAAAGHWLSRSHPKLSEIATFCSHESAAVDHTGKRWDKKLRRIAGRDDPVQHLFDAAWEDLDLNAHIKGWSWFDVFLSEDHDRFVEFLRRVRGGEDHRNAVKAAFGGSPEELDLRWRDRILGKRPTVAATPAELDAADPDRPGAAERDGIRKETDPEVLASRIRSLRTVTDPLTAATLVPRLGSESPDVRESAVVVLSRSKDPAVMAWLRTEGLATTRGVARAMVARILGNLGDPAAGDDLMKHAGDGFWLVRAHAARAIGLLRHEPGRGLLKERIDDPAPKVRIAAMDALACFGERAASAWEPVSTQLGASAWQVRSAAAGCLGALGDMRACEALISRMEIESGRIRKDIREALKRITRDDLGADPKYWRDWWDEVKERHGGNVPPRPGAPKEPPKGEHTYGEPPTYYGIRVFSQAVGYVLDISSSMTIRIEIDPDWLKKHRRDYPSNAPKFDLARSEIEASLRSLDRRTRFNLYFFRRDAFAWKSDLVPADPGNVESAAGRMADQRPGDMPRQGTKRTSSNLHQTNYVDAFRLVLDVDEGEEFGGGFRDTPDTIYFLTDGRPTTGDITESETLLSWYTELNRFARMRTNVIAFGRADVDVDFLRHLAEENGGAFVLVPEKR